MATLQSIRNKGPLLVAVIGIALVAFIVGDFLHSGATFFHRSRENVATIAGENIHFLEFQRAVDQMTEVYRIETGQNDLSEEIQSQIRASVWETMVNDMLLQREAKKIGLTVSSEELSDRLIGNNIHPIILQRQVFFDETGRFNRNILLNFLSSLDMVPQSHEMAMQLQQATNYWMFWENTVKNAILREKYDALLSQSVTVNSIDARAGFDARQRMVNFSYVAQPFFLISDELVSVSDREIRDRYNRDKHLFTQEASRAVSYVTFEVRPMEEDFAQAQEWMNRLSEEFRTTDDIVGLINSNSDVMYDGQKYSETTVPVMLRYFAFNGREGDFFGPLFINNTHTMARIMEAGIMTSDSVRLSHIYLFPGAEQLADSLYDVLRRNRNADFADLARNYSQVQQTAVNGGEIGWLVENARGIDREFMSAFERREGEIFMFRDLQGGTQIVQVTEKTTPRPKVKLAILERRVTPSSRTQARIFNDAKQFAVSARNVEDFQTLAEAEGLFVRQANNLNENTERIAMLPQSRPIVRWAFGANLGNVSDVFDIGDQFVVAVVTEVNRKGNIPLDRVANQIREELIREKKAELMVRNISEKLASSRSLENLARELDVNVREAENVSFASFTFGASGFEPFVIGSAMNIAMNEISQPIKGNSGVFVILPTSEVIGTDEFNAELEIAQMNSRLRHTLPFMILNDIRNNANITDNRAAFH